ncbi:hypothetical protein GCM10010112_06860 [Actinoplanes lobatus]|uniref:Diguanylate cyclase (GGDEF)-like protein n=1 Tax=Actinoplanes lobatus TaxID=113568 RepID=A0A7W7MEB9_9ACTN|nr:GGDEF domain-containing protein [Actinoplanes lobatus]MBB4747107.1 diguanylate cyclase (GGDEF)-like protein [Actinoplanes lobatus]GGN55750.1 hypothetical protein GCM10010112_06860 [Actinoplanes lobatus]GIE39326.1 hypothetical protein Alo02nite_22240 [Actinoplanes lobatus]
MIAIVLSLVTNDSPEPSLAAHRGFFLIDIMALACAVRAALRRDLGRWTRRAWWFIGAACVLLALDALGPEFFPTRPELGGALRLAFVPVMLAGLSCLIRGGDDRMPIHKILLDAGTVAVGAAMVMWYFVTGPALARALADTARSGPGGPDVPGGGNPLASAIAFPVGYAVLLFGVTLALMYGIDSSAQRSVRLLAGAVFCQVAAHVYLSYAMTRTGPLHGVALPFTSIAVSHFLLVAAAFEQSRAAQTQIRRRLSKSAVTLLPYASVLVGGCLLITIAVQEVDRYTRIGVTIGSVLLTFLVMFRQITVLRANHQLATTDPLTGLANRTRLNEALGLALARSARNGKAIGILLADLNGFKEINDTLGHEAGDQMLVAFAEMLRRSVLGYDVVARLGGDEFIAILHDIESATNAEAVVRRLREEMKTPVMVGDTAVRVRSAIGITIADPGESDGGALLRRADEAMYENKHLIKSGGSR